jgi:tRNA (guanine37-N1)-methyltransferase
VTISILTLFPEIFFPYITSSIIGRARAKKQIYIELINIRDFAVDKHKSVDDKPYGGGVGMILQISVLVAALEFAQQKYKSMALASHYNEKIVLLDPTGTLYNQQRARQYQQKVDHLILICGHYEGFDQRIQYFIDERISIGRYILTGGEIPALTILDSITRLIPHVLKKPSAVLNESYSNRNKFEAPSYTRPLEFRGHTVPRVLLSGNHKAIEDWKTRQVEMKKRKSN